MSVWFITGASRGFGLELAKTALAHGDQVVATARNPKAVIETLPEGGGSLLVAELDVTDQEQAEAAVVASVRRFGRIDVLVNNAGYGLFGAVEEISGSEARALFDTNVFGLLNVTRAVLPVLRSQGAGRIINIASSAAVSASAGRGLYGAAKSAVESISEAERAELAPLGIHVTVVEPGSFRTDFLSGDSVRRARRVIPEYSGTAGQLVSGLDGANGSQPGDPVKGVAAIRALAESANPPLRLPLGSDCVKLVERRLDSVAAELSRWRELALSTDFPSGDQGD
jgi:NAD(P)-dependent dehydrogenase (short-subunit alcohol dehydrogenase family)